MVPEDFFDEKEPDEETFEPTEQQYSDEDAIALLPRSKTWVVVSAGNKIDKMILYLMTACLTGSESISMCKSKAALVCNQLVNNPLSYDHVRMASKFMDCLIKIGERHLLRICLEHV